MAEQETPNYEYKAFVSLLADLVDSLVENQVITPFANRLVSEKLIDRKILINNQDERNPPYERANKIVYPLLLPLENPKKSKEMFVAIVKSLRKVGLHDIATELIKKLEESGGQVPQELIESKETQPTSISIDLEPGADDEVMKDANTKPDKKELLNIIATELGQKWEQFGMKLGFQMGELDSIAANNNYVPLECCRELFDSWEAKADKNYPFLWSTVLTSLKTPGVGLRNMAAQMEERRKTLKDKIASYNEEFKDLSYRTELDVLMEKVGYRVPNKWKPIASELGLSRGIIGSINCTSRSDMNRIMKVFDEWKRQIPKPDNWQVLLVALCMPQVGEKQIAFDVAEELRENK